MQRIKNHLGDSVNFLSYIFLHVRLLNSLSLCFVSWIESVAVKEKYENVLMESSIERCWINLSWKGDPKMTILKKNFESMKYIRRQSTFRKSRIFLRKIILVLPLLALNSNLMSQVFVLSYYIKTLQSSDTLRPTSCQFSRYDNVDDDDERDHHG